MSTVNEVRVPNIGDFKEVEVIELMVKAGDRVLPEQSLITVESDKASMEIPAPAGGVVRDIKVKVGDKVSEGSIVLLMDSESPVTSGADSKPADTSKDTPGPVVPPVISPSAVTPVVLVPPVVAIPSSPVDPLFKAHASPSVRQFARELGVDVARVSGTGPKGRIQRMDVQNFVKSALAARSVPQTPASGAAVLPFNLPAWPQVDFAKFGPVETVPLTRLRKLAGANLHRNWISIPHVTQFDEADITELEDFRKSNSVESEKQGFKLTLLAFLVRACVTVLREHPQFNASLDKTGENLVIKKHYHIGVAVDTPDGLVVPVIRDADRKGVFELARELAEVSRLARERKLKPGDMQGGTFSISSLGGIGGMSFTPIINAPEVAILGVSRSVIRPVWAGKPDSGQFQPRLMLPLSLSYDHRVIDGAAGARFTSALASVLSDIRRSLL